MPEGERSELVDKVLGNPAFERLGGYHIFFRRAAIPTLLFLIGLLTYTVLDGFLSHQTNMILTCVIVGLSLGPILNIERYYGVLKFRK